MTKVFFTGGGTAGHVTPNIALIEELRQRGWDCHYVGSSEGIEQRLTADLNIPFYGIASGKLRRYFSWQNFIDPFFIVYGCLQSLILMLRHKPVLVFSKGGFVAVPVVVAAWLVRVPVISHESDMTPGLANKLCLPFSKTLCVNFAETLDYLPKSMADRVVVTGSPLRIGLRHTDADRGRSFLGFDTHRPILLVVGGSLGARALNEAIWQNLTWLIDKYQVAHLVGAGNQNDAAQQAGYLQFEYLDDEYGDVLACSDVVISRAGANSLSELLSFQKPHLLVPLPAAASRGDQIINARVMVQRGLSLSIAEEALSRGSLEVALEQLLNRSEFRDKMAGLPQQDSLAVISGLIEAYR